MKLLTLIKNTIPNKPTHIYVKYFLCVRIELPTGKYQWFRVGRKLYEAMKAHKKEYGYMPYKKLRNAYIVVPLTPYFANNKASMGVNNHITLTLPDNSVDLGRIDYSFDKIKIEPTTKSGKAYVRVLEYLRKHKKEIANINVHVGWDKTTAKFTTVDGPKSVVCYANNKTQNNSKPNNHILHY